MELLRSEVMKVNDELVKTFMAEIKAAENEERYPDFPKFITDQANCRINIEKAFTEYKERNQKKGLWGN